MSNYSDITIHHPFSSSVQKEKYLLSYNGQYYEASHAIVELVEELQRYEEEKAAIEAYVRKKEGKYTPEQVREVIEKFIDPIFRAVPKKRSFLYEKELFSAGAIDRFSDTFRFLFHKAYMMVVLAGMLALDAWFFFTTSDLLLFNNKVNIYMVAGLLVFMLASSFFHELGHASACKYFGVRHGGIGFGLYLNFPVLYTDVTEVWKLNRAQRCVVNLAGVYFQSYWLIALLVAFLITGNDILRYLILIMNLGFVMTLNPFFKFDGYWIASDLLGVPNLRQRSLELPVPACPPEADRQEALPAPDTPAGEIRAAGVLGGGERLYGILLLLRYPHVSVPLCADLSRCSERTDSLLVQPHGSTFRLAAKHQHATDISCSDRLPCVQDDNLIHKTLCQKTIIQVSIRTRRCGTPQLVCCW